MASDSEKEYDFVVFGASGFTGKYVVEYVARTILDENQHLRWAIAGRNSAKLHSVLDEVSTLTGRDVKNVPVIEAEVDKPDSLATMCRKTKLVLNCVGPYRLYGEPVVKACVENGSHHVDISGEPTFLESMQIKYHEEAQKAKVYVIGAAGFDSVPCETGIKFLKDKFGGDVIHAETFLQTKSGQEGYTINAGTWKSAINGIASSKELKPLRQQIFSKPVPRSNHRLKPRGILFQASEVKSWCIPFPVTDKSVVNRTQYFNYHFRRMRPVQMSSYLAVPSLLHGLLVLLLGAVLGIFSSFKLGRYLLEKFPGLFSFGIFSNDGPTRKQVEGTSFTMTIVGHGYDESLGEVENQHSNPPNKKLAIIVSGPDAAYLTTSICMLDVALTTLQETDKLPDEGGVLTPGAALLNTTLMERLTKHGIKYDIK